MSLTAEEIRRLDEDGYVVLPDFMAADQLAALRQRVAEVFAAEGDLAGAEFKQEPGCRRLANGIDKGEVFRQAAGDARVLTYVEHVLGPDFKLSSLNVRSVNPHSDEAQPLHADMGAIRDERGWWVCNTVWMLDDFTPDNGPLRVVPGSQHWRQLPQVAMADPKARHPEEQTLTGKAGTVVVMNAHTWHGGKANATDRPRTAMHIFFARRDKPQQQYQKQLVRPEIQATLSPRLRWLLALDDPRNDELSAAPAVRSGFLK